jgi:unsaturated rhamnogalacturonyl hydrolase
VTKTLPVFALLAASPALAAADGGAPATPVVAVKVQNPLGAVRLGETATVSLADLRKTAPTLDPGKALVFDDKHKPVLSQLVDADGDETPDELVFQADLGGKETRTFTVESGVRTPFPRDAFRVYGRFVRERHDDFAWENDRIAHRMYGPGLETWKKEPLTSSGIDVWAKKAKRLVVNEWYMTDDYHRDNGDGADFYSVSKSRGCGGIAVFAGDKPAVSRNFVMSRVLAQGPIRLVFELDYAPFEVGANTRVSETKHITLDAGKGFNRIASTFKVEGGAPALSVGVGIGKHKGADLKTDKLWMRTWEPLPETNGSLGCAVVLAPGATAAVRATDLDTFLVAKATAGAPFVYYMGSDWSKREGGAADAGGWTKVVQDQAREIAAPVKVTLSIKK